LVVAARFRAGSTGKIRLEAAREVDVFGYLANMVATIPMWITMEINQDELDVAPVDGGRMQQKRLDNSEELVKALDKAAAAARSAFEKTTDEHLQTNWRLLARG
jgi:hypothetical protein